VFALLQSAATAANVVRNVQLRFNDESRISLIQNAMWQKLWALFDRALYLLGLLVALAFALVMVAALSVAYGRSLVFLAYGVHPVAAIALMSSASPDLWSTSVLASPSVSTEQSFVLLLI
jgi:hypothetical protein